MARSPDWFARLDAIRATLAAATTLQWLGRKEMGALFGCSERDSIRLLHKFGAAERGNALTIERDSLLPQLEAMAAGSRYAAFLRQREGVARHLAQARSETAAKQFRAPAAFPVSPPPRLDHLPATLIVFRPPPQGPARFEILYEDGADLLAQLAEFLHTVGANRAAFLAGTEPDP